MDATKALEIAPVMTSSALVMFAISQHLAMSGFLDPTVSKDQRETVWPRWLQTFGDILCVSAPIHLTTMLTCAVNIYIHSGSCANRLWLANIMFALGHGYPYRLGLTLMSFRGGRYDQARPVDVTRLLKDFRSMNKTRTIFVDIPGLLCAVAAALMVL